MVLLKKRTPELSAFVMMTEYAADIDAPVAFGPTPLINVLGEWFEKK